MKRPAGAQFGEMRDGGLFGFQRAAQGKSVIFVTIFASFATVRRGCAPVQVYACVPREARGSELLDRCFLFSYRPPQPELNSHTSILRMIVPEVKKKTEESRKGQGGA